MAIHVIQGGLLTTVQDGGRTGYQKKGIPVSGAMDLRSYRKANRLAGNAGEEAVLELTVFGGSYRFDEETRFALTGADMKPLLNGEPVPMNLAVTAPAGSVLHLQQAVSGCRTYLAVAGGIDVPVIMGSRSTYVRYSIGGFCGRALKKGDVLKTFRCGYAGAQEVPDREENAVYPTQFALRVIPGPQEHCFTEKGIRTFYTEEYEISGQSDRMGYRMLGASVESMHGTDILSDGTVFGSIQITGSGQPMILMADRQTTGGYAKIGTVFSEDLPLLAQAGPGARVRFSRMEEQEWMQED